MAPLRRLPFLGTGGRGLGGSAAVGAWLGGGGEGSEAPGPARLRGVIPGGLCGREAEELCCLLKSAVGRTELAFPCRPWSAGLLQPGSAGVDVARVGVGHKGLLVWDLVCCSWGSVCCCCKGLEASMGEMPFLGFLTSSLKALTLPGGAVPAGVIRAEFY